MCSCVEAKAELVERLIATTDGVAETIEDRLRSKSRVALAGVHQMEPAGSLHAGGERSDPLFDAMLSGGDQFGSSGWCGGAKIRNEIGDGEVGLMADRRDDGNLGGCDGAGERLVVEAGEIFD